MNLFPERLPIGPAPEAHFRISKRSWEKSMAAWRRELRRIAIDTAIVPMQSAASASTTPWAGPALALPDVALHSVSEFPDDDQRRA